MSLNLFSDTTFKEQIILLLSTRHQILLYNIPTQDLITLHTGLDKGASIKTLVAKAKYHILLFASKFL
jgi:hypothetical protein